MEAKPKRRTRERILEASLRLFNTFGEPNVTTTLIADELDISPGNLYYHFHSKDEIVNAIFADFEREMVATLNAPTRRAVDVEDIWLFLHLLFEGIWKHRFLYRDLSDLLTRNRTLELRFGALLQHKARTARAICDGLVATGEMRATPAELDALVTNATVIATYWLSFEYVRNPRGRIEGAGVERGVFQVMALTAPYLVGRARALFDRLAAEYVRHPERGADAGIPALPRRSG